MIRPTTAEEVRQVLDDYEKMIADQGNQQVEVVTYDKMSRRERDTVDYIVGELYSISQEDAVQIVVERGINEARELGSRASIFSTSMQLLNIYQSHVLNQICKLEMY